MLSVLMPLKDRLKELRKAAGLTQQALAEKARLSISAVVHIEKGRIPDPRASTVKALAGALGVTIDELLANDDQGEPPAEAPPPESPAPKRRKPKGGK
jgi:transcriptional regulator with XRE-family HTH domain